MSRILILLLVGLSLHTVSFGQYVMNEAANHIDKPIDLPPSDVYNIHRWVKKNILTGKEIDLYNELDSGLVIVQEYVMMDCRPCITGGKGLQNIITSMRKSYPGRIRYYQTVYDDATNEETMQKWVKTNGFKPDAFFIQGAKEVAAYGGMGMPTIMVMGAGMRHKGYYKKLGYSPLENGVIIRAIRRGLSLSVNKFAQGNK